MFAKRLTQPVKAKSRGTHHTAPGLMHRMVGETDLATRMKMRVKTRLVPYWTAWALAVLLSFSFLPVHRAAEAATPVSSPGDHPAGLLVKVAHAEVSRLGAVPPDAERTTQELTRLAQEQNLHLAQVWPALGVGLLQSDPLSSAQERSAQLARMEAARHALAADPAVAYVEADALVYAADLAWAAPSPNAPDQGIVFVPNDPRRSEQYALERIFAYAGWTLNQGSGDIVVAVVDSGYDLLHEDLDEASVWHNTGELTGTLGVDDDGNGYVDDLMGWDWIENDNVTNDPYGHGSHVGGVIAAATNNGVGVASVGRNLRVMPLRILDRNGYGNISGLINALAYAAAQGVRVINLSLITTTNSATLHSAIQQAAAKDILIVAAAGNNGTTVSNFYPAAWPETFTVSATDGADNVTLFSNYGDAVDVGAPGSFILSTYENNTYQAKSGTSMATPHVSALAGLLLSLRPDLTLIQLTDLIRSTADDANSVTYPGPDSYLGDGRINVQKALHAASAGLVLSGDTDNLLASQTADSLEVQAAIADGRPSGGTVIAYGLYPESGKPSTDMLLTGHTLTSPTGTASISVTLPLTQGLYSLDLTVGQASATLPVFVYAAPLRISLTTPAQEVTAEDTALPFVLEVRDNDGVLLPVPVMVHLDTNVGFFENGRQSITVRVEGGQYSGALTSWSLVDLIDGAILIDATMPATNTSAQIRVPVTLYTYYLGLIHNR